MLHMIVSEIKQELKQNKRSYESNKMNKQECKINKVCLEQDLEDALDEHFDIKEKITDDNDIVMLEKIQLLELYNEYDRIKNIIDDLKYKNDSSIMYYYDRQQEIINEIEEINSICYEDLEEGISYV